MENIVEVSHLTKKFGNDTAIDDISFNIKRGKVVGLVGPDAAGKTTLMRLLVGLLDPTKGRMKTVGLNPVMDGEKLHKIVGYMPQKFGLYEDLSVQENLDLYADLKEIPLDQRKGYFDTLLDFTSLRPFTKRLAGRLSGGMKQKLGLACALLGEPKFLVLDEPGVGVDPISRRDLMKMVRSLNKNDMTILWSTSYLDEAESFDEVILLNEGKIIYEGIPSDLTKTMEGHVFHVKQVDVSNRTLLRKILRSKQNVVDVVIEADTLRIVMKDARLKTKFEQYLEPIKPRFEDAVIDILGGIPTGESKLSRSTCVNTKLEYVIEAKHLTKVFGTFTAANDINFRIKKGEIFGLLGPNGAGKSTSFRMMCGLSKPTKGDAFLMDINMRDNPVDARSQLGYMAQKFSLAGTLSVKQNLDFFSGIYGLENSKRQKKIEEIIKIFDFQEYVNSRALDLPLGYKQRLSLACAVMHNPPVLFLDEPTSGVDPLTRREFWNHINTMVEKGVTVMVTTHFMDEAEYCDRIALIYRGQAIKIDTPSNIKKEGETMEDAFIRTIYEYDEANDLTHKKDEDKKEKELAVEKKEEV